ncbi:MAG: hypothetical protein ACYC64_19420 [Armatimonadota bacterium]
MLSARICLVLCIVFPALVSMPAFAQSDVPDNSMCALQNTLSATRDKLWENNDKFWHRGEYERCIATMRLVTQIDPHDIEAYDDGAWLMQNQLRDEEAEAFLLEGLRSNGDVYDLYFALGHFYYMHEQFDKAVDCLALATTFDPPMIVWNTLAHAYEHAGYVDSALNIWALRKAADPDDPVPHIQINRITSGEPPSNTPGIISRAREERKARAGIR